MALKKHTTYGPGGYDPSKPNSNIVEENDVVIPAEEENRTMLESRLDSSMENLVAYRALSNTQAQAQLVPIVKLLCWLMLTVIRLMRNRTDGTD